MRFGHVSRFAAGMLLVCMISWAVLSFVGASTSMSAAAQPGEHPVAIITPLPDFTSNGTRYYLNGNMSYDPDGFIVNYTWELRIGSDPVQLFYAKQQPFRFTIIGLYEINLTVQDNQGNIDKTWTACVSIPDSDHDTLEDWWEVKYFDGSLDETADGDFDNDGYSNGVEQDEATDPTVKDPQPSLISMLADYWYYLVIVAAAIVAAIVLLVPWQRKRRKVMEKKKIAAAIEIEKALESDED